MSGTLGALPRIHTMGSPEFYTYHGGALDANSAVGNAIWGTANHIHYYPFLMHSAYTVATFGVAQNAQGAGTTCRMGIYSAAGAKLVETNGTVSLAVGGGNVVRAGQPAATYDLAAGTLYYFALTVSSAGAWTGITNGASAEADAYDILGAKQEAGSGTLPSTATFADFATDQQIWACGFGNPA